MGDFIMTTCSYIFKNINQRTYDFHKQNELEKKKKKLCDMHLSDT